MNNENHLLLEETDDENSQSITFKSLVSTCMKDQDMFTFIK